MFEVDAKQGGVGDGDARRGTNHPIDPVTKLPLLICPDCKDINFVAYTVRKPDSPNLGRRFFKCPRNNPGEEYERYILAATTDHGVIQEAEVTLSTDLSPTDQENLAEVVGDRDYHSEPEPNQSSEPANSFAKDGTVSTVSSKQSQEIGLYESSAMFWMKFIATQLLILNFLVFLLVVIAISV
ncbi:uncharacterized protein LOC110431275 isoform X2 [Sorghum bicolor]|uniref:uncharacterized protein LOC110431275 isoform X2 n=1 Tax=Sorghum bicolor TaxID=4558 RepID=UPI000B4245B2|nr:uncharacterized protein LOC110431275 isoform X2 [Sorghum bicolor]|eukprot:XP_021305876.1 uncharacterized protein LOC110431275 isoform X2 [Sorghum bicolor]